MNCKTCAIACADKNDLPVAVSWRRVVQYGGGGWIPEDGLPIPDNVFTYSISLSCMHCATPPCLEVCPEEAISKGPDGIVRICQDLCVACRSCQEVCPYGAPQFDEEAGVMTKCDACSDLLEEGQNPACVDACPMRALHFGPMSELRRRYGNLNSVAPLPDGRTGPSVVITPHRHALSADGGNGRILDVAGEEIGQRDREI
jgi:anaerobic dimethyl sulfoxide reductase subunit B (iron-sulfur subunit)